MKVTGLILLLALLAVILAREIPRVRAVSVKAEEQRNRPRLVAELVLLGGCLVVVLPRLTGLLT